MMRGPTRAPLHPPQSGARFRARRAMRPPRPLPALLALLALAALASGASTPARAAGCRVTVSPLTLAGTTPARLAALEPSPSKVPTVVHGLVDMMVVATDGAIEVGDGRGGRGGKADHPDPLRPPSPSLPQPPFTLEASLPPGATVTWATNMELTGEAPGTAATFASAANRPLLTPGSKPAHVAYQVNATSQAFAPTAVSVNGAPCELEAGADLAAPVPPLPTPADPLAAAGLRRSWQAEKPVSTNGALLIGVDGKPFTVKGLNWFGFENGQTIVDGLWGNVQDAVVADFATVAWRMKLLGFNTIRLPFSFQAFGQAPRDPTYRTCNNVTDAAVRASVIKPGVSVPAAAPLWRLPAGIPQTPGVCNDYVPRDSVRQRLLWASRFLAANGFYVVLDDHMIYDTLVRREGRGEGESESGSRKRARPTTPPLLSFLFRSWTTPPSGCNPGPTWPATWRPTR